MIVPASPLTPAREGSGPEGPDGQAAQDGQAVAGGVRVGVPVTVRTPATSANLGPGFDSLGLALSLYDEIEVVAGLAADGGVAVEVDVEGEGAGVVPCDEHHLVVRAIRAGLEHAGAGPVRLGLRCRNVIPHGRGLGSSASAVVAGLVAARGLLADPSSLDDAALLRLATAFEGHPDNAAAALLGGFTVSWTETGPGPLDGDPTRAAQPFEADPAGTALPSPPEPPALFEPAPAPAGRRPYPHLPDAHAVAMPVHPDLRVVACVPQVELATSVARKMLPAEVPHGDAAFNAGRSALLVEAMSRRPELLFAATADRLHQCQRAAAMPDSARLVRELRGSGAAAVVSGAGPTVLVLGTGESPRLAVREVLERMDAQSRWRVLCLVVDTVGATVVTHSRDL